MSKTLKVNDREYRIKRIDPFLQPYIAYFSKLVSETPQSLEEAEKASEELRRVVDRVLEVCLEPMPPEEDRFDAFLALMSFIAEVGEERTTYIKRFRRGSSMQAGGGAGVGATRTTKRATGGQ